MPHERFWECWRESMAYDYEMVRPDVRASCLRNYRWAFYAYYYRKDGVKCQFH